MADDPAQRWQTLEAGRFPTAPGEGVADATAAEANQVAVGDRIRVGSGSRSLDVTVVGLVDSPSAVVASALYVPWDDLAAFAPRLRVDSVAYDGAGTRPPCSPT